MTCLTARPWLVVALLATLPGAARSGDSGPAGVVDEAGLFRPEHVARATTLIRDLQRDYHFDIRVETFGLPEDERRKVDSLTYVRAKARYFAGRARERAEAAGIDGLLIQICTAPPNIQITAYPKSAEALFSRDQQRVLQRRLRDRLQGTLFGIRHDDAAGIAVGSGWRARPPAGADAALLDAVSRVGAAVRERAGSPNAAKPTTIGAVLAGGVAAWLVLALLRRRLARRDPEAGLLGPAGEGRGAALLAAQFGTPAAHWIYDRLFFGSPNAAVAPVSPAAGGVAAQAERRKSAPEEIVHPQPDHVDAAAGDGLGSPG